MILPKEKIEEMVEAAKPLVKWMNENVHPHCTVLVETDGAQLVEGVAAVKIEEFIKD